MKAVIYDRIILGAGLYGLYAARACGLRGERVLVLEYDPAPFMRATYINQARVHMGYHYPRSYATAIKSAHYYARFHEDFGFCIHSSLDQIYATSTAFSWTDAAAFQKFCQAAGIRCDEVPVSRYFQPGMCDGAFLTTEDTYDAQILREFYEKELRALPNVTLQFGVRIAAIRKDASCYTVRLADGREASAGYLLNATYASTNQILAAFENIAFPPIRIKYELCEIILCDVSEQLKGIGLTVMDGPFFSVMPFGKTGLHSLTAVTFTPHVTSYEMLPHFACQARRSDGACSPAQLANCNDCPAKPASAWPYMSQMARKYVRPEYDMRYVKSLFSMKPILQAAEIDDSRPTVIRVLSESPTLVSVLSGKINTVYDLDEVLFS